MSDYVEAGKILEFLDAETNALNSTFGEIDGEAGAYVACFKNVRSYIERFPTADVAPVVRCENCTSGIMADDNKYIICCRLGVGMELDDFCSYGEGKNGGSDYATD